MGYEPSNFRSDVPWPAPDRKNWFARSDSSSHWAHPKTIEASSVSLPALTLPRLDGLAMYADRERQCPPQGDGFTTFAGAECRNVAPLDPQNCNKPICDLDRAAHTSSRQMPHPVWPALFLPVPGANSEDRERYSDDRCDRAPLHRPRKGPTSSVWSTPVATRDRLDPFEDPENPLLGLPVTATSVQDKTEPESDPNQERFSRVLWVGNVPKDVSAIQLWHFFETGNLPVEPFSTQPVAGSSPKGPRRRRNKGKQFTAHPLSTSTRTNGPPQIARPPAVLVRRGGAPPVSTALPGGERSQIESIYVIKRSYCAFVNFITSADASAPANLVEQYNGRYIRPPPPGADQAEHLGPPVPTRPPREGDELPLILRVRDLSEALEAGVSVQRKQGHHVAYARAHNRAKLDRRLERKEARERWADMCQSHAADTPGGTLASEAAQPHTEADGHGCGLPSSAVMESGSMKDADSGFESDSDSDSSSIVSVDSGTSNSSAVLSHPSLRTRFFILKTRTIAELQHSVKTGLWFTQLHNEFVLNQAFHHSSQVYLIFSANQSGSWFGYAHMTEPIPHTSSEQGGGDPSAISSLSLEAASDASTSNATPRQQPKKYSLYASSAEREGSTSMPRATFAPEVELGHQFTIHWDQTATVPFAMCRKLRNPWRENKQIKVSRDGIELEPAVGWALKGIIDTYATNDVKDTLSTTHMATSSSENSSLKTVNSNNTVQSPTAKRTGTRARLRSSLTTTPKKDRQNSSQSLSQCSSSSCHMSTTPLLCGSGVCTGSGTESGFGLHPDPKSGFGSDPKSSPDSFYGPRPVSSSSKSSPNL